MVLSWHNSKTLCLYDQQMPPVFMLPLRNGPRLDLLGRANGCTSMDVSQFTSASSNTAHENKCGFLEILRHVLAHHAAVTCKRTISTLGQEYAELGILALLALNLGMAALCAWSVCVASWPAHHTIILRIQSGASRHFACII